MADYLDSQPRRRLLLRGAVRLSWAISGPTPASLRASSLPPYAHDDSLPSPLGQMPAFSAWRGQVLWKSTSPLDLPTRLRRSARRQVTGRNPAAARVRPVLRWQEYWS